MLGGSYQVALSKGMRRYISLDRLRESEHDLGAMLRGAKQHLFVRIAEVPRLEQDGGRIRPPKDVERREPMRIGTKLKPAGRFVDKTRGKIR